MVLQAVRPLPPRVRRLRDDLADGFRSAWGPQVDAAELLASEIDEVRSRGQRVPLERLREYRQLLAGASQAAGRGVLVVDAEEAETDRAFYEMSVRVLGAAENRNRMRNGGRRFATSAKPFDRAGVPPFQTGQLP